MSFHGLHLKLNGTNPLSTLFTGADTGNTSPHTLRLDRQDTAMGRLGYHVRSERLVRKADQGPCLSNLDVTISAYKREAQNEMQSLMGAGRARSPQLWALDY